MFCLQVKLIDNFTNKKGMTSHCYRIAYRSMERSLTDEEINSLQVTCHNSSGVILDVIFDFESDHFCNFAAVECQGSCEG
jgi:hypothetical protein